MDKFFSRFITLMTFYGLTIITFTSTPVAYVISTASAESSSASISLSPVVKEHQGQTSQYVFDVVIHEPEEMDKLLDRIEQLSSSHPPGKQDPSLALVLHGPEIAFFTRMNYTKYMDMVDRAAELDKKGVIDVKVCDTMIRALDLEDAELPDFVEHVPYGPTEIDKLIQQGFIKM